MTVTVGGRTVTQSPCHGRANSARRLVALVSAALLAIGTALVAAPAADAAVTASLSINKSASDTELIPGQAFEYTIQIECTAPQVSGCVDAAIADTMPRYIQVTGTPTITGHNGTQQITGDARSVDVSFVDDLGGGQTGLTAGQVVTGDRDPDHPAGPRGGRHQVDRAGRCAAQPGRPLSIDVTGTNRSNTAVDTLVVCLRNNAVA